jgi:hypothetical protein
VDLPVDLIVFTLPAATDVAAVREATASDVAEALEFLPGRYPGAGCADRVI